MLSRVNSDHLSKTNSGNIGNPEIEAPASPESLEENSSVQSPKRQWLIKGGAGNCGANVRKFMERHEEKTRSRPDTPELSTRPRAASKTSSFKELLSTSLPSFPISSNESQKAKEAPIPEPVPVTNFETLFKEINHLSQEVDALSANKTPLETPANGKPSPSMSLQKAIEISKRDTKSNSKTSPTSTSTGKTEEIAKKSIVNKTESTQRIARAATLPSRGIPQKPLPSAPAMHAQSSASSLNHPVSPAAKSALSRSPSFTVKKETSSGQNASRPLTTEQKAALVAKRRAATQSSLPKPTAISTPPSASTKQPAIQKTASMKNLPSSVKEAKKEIIEETKELIQQLSPKSSKKEIADPAVLISEWIVQFINQQSIQRMQNASVALLVLKQGDTLLGAHEGVLRNLPEFGNAATEKFKKALQASDSPLNSQKLALQVIIVEKNNSKTSNKIATLFEYGFPVNQFPLKYRYPANTPKNIVDHVNKVYLDKIKTDRSEPFLKLIQLLFSTTPHST